MRRSAWHPLLFAFLGMLLFASPASPFDWSYLGMAGETSTCIEVDPIHDRVLVGTIEGFHYYDMGSQIWTNRDDDGSIGRTVWSIQWHETLSQRVVTGREDAFFKGYIELSDDLGTTEELVYSSEGGWVADLAASGDQFWACTWSDIGPGEFVRSEDGGENWSLLGGHGHTAMTSLSLSLGDDELYLGGDNRVTRSLDSGDTWESLGGNLPAQLVTCLEPTFPGGDLLPPISLLAGNESGLYYTETPGVWGQILDEPVSRVVSYPGPGFFPAPPFHIAVVTQDGRLLRSENFGGTWVDETGNLPGPAVDVAYAPADVGLYVCTLANGVYRVRGVVTAVPDEQVGPPGLTLRALSNPFQSRTELLFSQPEAGQVTLTVHDATGRRVATLLDEESVHSGIHSVPFEADGLAGGVYFARVSGESGASSTRLVLLK